MVRITVVNDNPDFLEAVKDVLEDDRYDAIAVDGDRPDALDLIRQSRPDVLMIDLRLGSDGLRGWEIAKQVRREPDFDSLPVLVCSGDLQAMEEIAAELAAAHNVATLPKPFGIDDLTEAIESLSRQ